MKTSNYLRAFILFSLATVLASDVTAGHPFTDGRIRYFPGTSFPRLEITLTTNPAILEPMPGGMDLEAILDYHQRVLAYADWDDPPLKITIPLFSYGEAPSFSKAMIKKGPGVSIDVPYLNATNKTRHNGLVRIIEFSKTVIEAEYSASLFSVRYPDPPKSEGEVSGWFRISMPGLHDPRINNELSESEQVRLPAALLWSFLRGMGMSLADADIMGINGGVSGGPNAGAGNGSPVDILRDDICTCECEHLVAEESRPDCAQRCAPVWEINQCDSNGFSLLQASDAEIDQFAAGLGELDLPEATEKAYKIAFEISSEQVREQLWEAVRIQQAEHQQPAQKVITDYPGLLDDETLRYQSDMEQFDLSPDIVADMVENFHNSDAAARAFLSEQMERMKQQKN